MVGVAGDASRIADFHPPARARFAGRGTNRKNAWDRAFLCMPDGGPVAQMTNQTSTIRDSSPSNRDNLRFLAGGRNWTVLAIAFTAACAGFAEAAVLASIAQVGAALISGTDHVRVDFGPIHTSISITAMIWSSGGLVLVRIGLLGLNVIAQSRLGSEVQAELRGRLFAAFANASWSVQSRDTEGHLQEMLTSQALQASWGTVQIAALISAVFTFVVLIISAMALNPLAAASVVAIAAVIWGLLRPLSALGQRCSKELSRSQMAYASKVGEAIRLAEESHVFGVFDMERKSLEGLVGTTRDLMFRSSVVNRFAPNLFQGLIYLTVVGGLGLMWETGTGKVASLGAVVLLLIRAGNYGQQIQGSYQLVRQALPFVERLRLATNRYLDERKSFGVRRLTEISSITFDDVSFSYVPEKPVLNEVSFAVSRGEVIGIVGPSGAGKSTIVQLLLQLRRPDNGVYALNGIPAFEFLPGDWHRQVAYVPQEPRLLHASAAENIRYYRDISIEEVERAAKLARIHDEILRWKDGYRTVVGPRADSVSGGQQQRICVARALAARPALLILDEPTSALDPRSESLIRDSLDELASQLTIFIVTHRMSTLSVCDRVVVIADNRLDGFGTPEGLMAENEYLRNALHFSASGGGTRRQTERRLVS